MFVDASAIIAILSEEPDGPEIASRIEKAASVSCSPIVRYEAVVGFARSKWSALHGKNTPISADFMAQAEQVVISFLTQIGAEERPITSEIGTAAIRAATRFGRGTGHPAKLNFGDCFSYACAKSAGVPLLFKGEDFTHTDVEVA